MEKRRGEVGKSCKIYSLSLGRSPTPRLSQVTAVARSDPELGVLSPQPSVESGREMRN